MARKSKEPKFIADQMYYRIARILRMLGYDSIIDPEFVDVNYILRANKENRILLTRDADLKRRAEKLGITVLKIDAPTIEERLAILSKNSKIELAIRKNVLSRCTLCNAEIEIVSKEQIINQLKNGTKEKYNEFWMCKSETCKQVYWQGPHWEQLLETLDKSKKLLKKIKNK